MIRVNVTKFVQNGRCRLTLVARQGLLPHLFVDLGEVPQHGGLLQAIPALAAQQAMLAVHTCVGSMKTKASPSRMRASAVNCAR